MEAQAATAEHSANGFFAIAQLGMRQQSAINAFILIGPPHFKNVAIAMYHPCETRRNGSAADGAGREHVTVLPPQWDRRNYSGTSWLRTRGSFVQPLPRSYWRSLYASSTRKTDLAYHLPPYHLLPPHLQSHLPPPPAT
jgi:hypothetical protein